MKVVQDPVKLDQQIALSKEYAQRSKILAEESRIQPAIVRKTLEAKNFSNIQIQHVLNGMAQSEAESEKTPVKIMTFRTQHAEILLKGLEQLKAWKGKWKFSDEKGTIVFDSVEQLKFWKNDVITPLIAVEKKLV